MPKIDWPIRAVWSWPAATATIAALEIGVHASQRSVGLVAYALAIASAATMGAWLALVAVLVSVLARRRGWRWPDRWRPGPARVATLGAAALLAMVALPLASWVVGEVHVVVEQHPIDYPQTSRQLWRGAAFVAVPIALVAFVVLAGPLARWLQARRGPLALRLGATAVFAIVVAHFGGGAFTVYFGSDLALLLVVAGAIVAASWLPQGRSDRIGALACVLSPLVLALGVVGLHHAEARALLLHRSQLSPAIVGLGVGWLDQDGDGDLPAWLGGGDCDDGDPAVSIARTEIPGNGIDDNCWAGDRARIEATRATATPLFALPPIVLVTIDTVRADRLELLGAPRTTMPILSAYASRGLVFERAYAPANHTFYSMTALLAGQATERMLVPGKGELPQLRFGHWLPQRLHELGYRTVAIAPPLVGDGKLAPNELRIDDVDLGPFDGGAKNRSTTARQIADDATRRIDAWPDDRALALWIHFMDPHAVHESPLRVEKDDGRDAYDDELSWVDLQLGRVLAAVQRRFGESAIVVITADHGESLGEDGDWGHGFGLAEREIRVPLVLVAPGIAPGRRGDPVSLLSIVPTVLELLGHPPDPALVDAPSLFASPGFAIAENPAFLWNELRMEAALVEAERKLVWSRTTNTLELYDLSRDPSERENLASSWPEERERMLARLQNELEAGH